MSLTDSPDDNNLLAGIPAAEFARLAPHLERVPMPLGEMLYEPGELMRHAYFPTTAVVSLHYVTESGASVETAGVGNEGVVGISLFMGGGSTPSSAVVQIGGYGYRLQAHFLHDEFKRLGAVQSILLRYTQALLTVMAQTAVCNRHHTVEQQVCRWLLSTLDRVPSREFIVTQEQIANTLGVRRESVTDAASTLQRAGFIRYRRGHIAVVERSGLASRACECYSVLRQEMRRLRSAARCRQLAAAIAV
jgi:CRP-like cAMP-binding protein